MTDSELQNFIRAIEKRQKNEFGLVKMSQLNIDAHFPSPPGLTWAQRTTLLEYASWKGADAISGALLRAGADASIGAQGAVASHDSAAALRTLLPRAAVWTVNQVVAMRAAAAAAEPARMVSAGGGGGDGENALGCEQAQAHGISLGDAQEDSGPTVKWAACGHVTSEASLWADLRATGKLACMCGATCKELQSVEEEEALWPDRPDEAAKQRKLTSWRRFDTLPVDISEKRDKEAAKARFKIPSFAAMPASEVAKLYIGGEFLHERFFTCYP